MERRGHRVGLMSSLSVALISIVCFAFVNDTDLPVVAKSKQDTGETVAIQFQNALNDWAGIIRATGGELEPEKSWCYLIDFDWNGEEWIYWSKDKMEATFTMKNGNDQSLPLDRLKVSKGRETLGVYILMDGNFYDQERNLREVCKEFAVKMNATDSQLWTAIYT